MPKHNLLVADADPRSLRILDVALRRAGFAVATAGDGGEALRRIQRAVPDLVLAETGLPTQDGFELCRTLRGDDRFGTIPVLLMSGDRDPQIRIHAGEAAFYRLLGWEQGTFRVEFGSFPRTPRTEAGTQALLLEAMRRIDEAGRLAELLPPTTVLGVDFDALARRLGDLPDEVNGVL